MLFENKSSRYLIPGDQILIPETARLFTSDGVIEAISVKDKLFRVSSVAFTDVILFLENKIHILKSECQVKRLVRKTHNLILTTKEDFDDLSVGSKIFFVDEGDVKSYYFQGFNSRNPEWIILISDSDNVTVITKRILGTPFYLEYSLGCDGLVDQLTDELEVAKSMLSKSVASKSCHEINL